MSLQLYFRRIDVIGSENVPKHGPVIFVSNHPSALIDPLLVATTLKRKIHFLAASEFFGKGLKARILKNKLNMIPVHRPWLSKGEKVSNAEMFNECYKSLNQDKCIILFPEASSETVSKIRELKTGAVRIKAGFEAFTQGTKSVCIIPIGLNYSNPHEFQSRVVVKIGEPIVFDPSGETDLIERYRIQTSQVQEELKKSIIHIDNTHNEGLVKNVCRLFIETHRKEKGLSFRDGKSNFEFYQSVANAVAHFERTNAKAYLEMSTRIDTYFNNIHQLGISDDVFDQTEQSNSFFNWIFLVLGSLIALPSLIVFFLPYQLTKIIFRKKVKAAVVKEHGGDNFHYAFTATLIFVIGLLIFGLWTPVLGAIVYLITWNWWIALISMVLLYPMMRFSMHYAKVGLQFWHSLKSKRIWNAQKERVSFYAAERKSIVDALKDYQISYEASSAVNQ